MSRKAPDLTIVIADLGAGGAQRMVHTLLTELVARSYRCEVLTLSGPDADHFVLPDGVARRALDVIRVSRSPVLGLARNLARILAVRRALRESGAPVVLSFVAATNVLAILACTGLGRRVVISEVNDPSRQWLGPVWNRLRRWIYPRADLVTANSVPGLEALRSFVPAARLAWGPNPVIVPYAANATASDAPTILLIGRYERQKAHDVLLHAFALVAARFADWRLSFVGYGREQSALTALAAQLGLADRIEWVAPVRDVWPLYRRAQIFVLPSRFEGTPNVLAEAMACGLPVILSDAVTGARSYVDDGIEGRIVPVEGIRELSAALTELMADPALRARMGAAAARRVSGDTGEAAIRTWLAALALAPRC